MPKSSLEGSIFPGLEQEQRSAPHPNRIPAAGKKKPAERVIGAENSQKAEKNRAGES